MERPRIGRAMGETEAAAQTSAMAAITSLSRVVRLILKMAFSGWLARHAYSIRSNRPTIGVAPGWACGSTRNTIFEDLNVAL